MDPLPLQPPVHPLKPRRHPGMMVTVPPPAPLPVHQEAPSPSSPPLAVAPQRPPRHQAQPFDADRGELRPLDCNLAALCDHIQGEGFNSGEFSDVVVQAMGSTYRLHRLILSRSAYFRNMLHGPWKEAGAPTVVLHIDDDNVNSEAIAMALAYLYGQPPKLNDNNAFRVLAAASFLDLQDLCAICTDFIISELWTTNFLQYQVFAESQDYGIHGERVRNACWGYLCQGATMELREVLPKLSSQTLHALLTSDELWVPNEEKRFELALYALLAKCAISEEQVTGEESLNSKIGSPSLDSDLPKGRTMMNNSCREQLLESELHQLHIQDDLGNKAAKSILVDLADCPIGFQTTVSYSKLAQNDAETAMRRESDLAMEGPSGESTCYQLNDSMWLPVDQSHNVAPINLSSDGAMPQEWVKCNLPLWGGRIVGRRQVKSVKGSSCLPADEYDSFISTFEGGSLLYSNMSFESLVDVRKQLEELGFPCKAVNDGLWLQMLLCQRVQAIGADTCRNCCLTSNACACRQAYGYSHGGSPRGGYRQDRDRSSSSGNIGNIYLSEAQADGSGLFGPVRVHVRGTVDGLAGIGRGTSNAPGAAWPPTRYVFSRVPFGLGTRNCQQSVANDESEPRVEHNGDLSGDGLTALVGLSHGNAIVHVHTDQTERGFQAGHQSRYTVSAALSGANSSSVQMLESQENVLGLDWEVSEGSTISLDMKTPLSHFPPFRFGVEFEDVHRLTDGQVKHSSEVFYAGSLWKVSVQAFNDEDPQGHRTLGLFLHRRKAEVTDSLRKVHMYVDSREKVTARYQLICPSKREVMVFGSLKQAGTLLPKAPKGWGWRTALLFDELADLLQGGALRIAAVVQLI